MLFLRQSTASQEVLLGPFVDKTDGSTAETALSIANTDIKIWAEGATTEFNKTSGGATHIAGGRYYTVLDATDTATVGKLEINVHMTADALPVRREFMVLEEAVYDALFASSAAGYQVPIWAAANSTVNLSATTIKTATDVETDTADIQARIPAALVSGRIDASVGAMATDVLTSTALATSAVTEIQSGLSTLDAAGIRTAVGLASANLDTQLTTIDDFLDTEVAAIKAKTDLIPAAPASTTNITSATGITVSAIGAGVITAASIAADAIGASELAADAVAEIADAVWDEARSGHSTAGTFGESFQAVVNGSCITGTLTTTSATTDLTEATNDHYIGRTIVWITGVLAGQASAVTDYVGATKALTYTLVTDAPSNGDRFVLV